MKQNELKFKIYPFWIIAKNDSTFTDVTDLNFDRKNEVFFEFNDIDKQYIEFSFVGKLDKYFIGDDTGTIDFLIKSTFDNNLQEFLSQFCSIFENNNKFIDEMCKVKNDSIFEKSYQGIIEKYRGFIAAANLGLI